MKTRNYNKTNLHDAMVIICNRKYSFHRVVLFLLFGGAAVFVIAKLLGVK